MITQKFFTPFPALSVVEMQPIATAPPQPGPPQPGPPQPGPPQPGPPQPGPPTVGWSLPNMNCPPGLEYLMDLDYLFVDQQIDLLEVFTGWDTKNKYLIKDKKNEPVFYMLEESGFCWRLCLGSSRACEFAIYDKNQQEVLRLIRPFRCDSCCCPCDLQVLEVYSRNTLLGSVTQEWSIWRPKFYIRDASGEPVLMIKGPLINFCIDVIFKIKSIDDKHRIGMIQKKWSDFAREMFTVADTFGIHFPRDLDVKIKAVLLGACILIDFMYFEEDDYLKQLSD